MSVTLAISSRAAALPQMLPPHSSWMAALDVQGDTLRAGAVQHFQADREVFCEGDSADLFYKVVSGTVRTCKFLSDGRRQIEAFYSAGDVFGFELAGGHRFSAEAVNDCNLIAYRRRGVEAAALQDRELSRQLLSYALHSATDARAHAFLLGRRAATEKVAAFLLDWAKRCGEAQVIGLPMSRQDMGDYLGLTIETVSRTLSQFEREGLIAIPNARQIRLLRTGPLEDLVA